jgi:hypothetical protein
MDRDRRGANLVAGELICHSDCYGLHGVWSQTWYTTITRVTRALHVHVHLFVHGYTLDPSIPADST